MIVTSSVDTMEAPGGEIVRKRRERVEGDADDEDDSSVAAVVQKEIPADTLRLYNMSDWRYGFADACFGSNGLRVKCFEYGSEKRSPK